MRRRGLIAGLLASIPLAWAALLPNTATAVVGASRAGLIASKVVYDPDALLWKAAVVTAGGTVSDARLLLVSNLIKSLKSSGVWSKLDRLWLLAAENTQSALIDLVALGAATAVNSPTFATDRGYTGNGTTSYLDTGFNPTSGANYSFNSKSFGLYTRTNRTSGANMNDMGAGARDTFWPWYGDGTCYFWIGGNSSTNHPSTVQGMWILSRTNSTDAALYQNGSQVTVQTSTPDTVTLGNFFVLAGNNGSGSPSELSTDQQAAAFVGGGLTSTDASNLSSAINTYMTPIGASVY